MLRGSVLTSSFFHLFFGTSHLHTYCSFPFPPKSPEPQPKRSPLSRDVVCSSSGIFPKFQRHVLAFCREVRVEMARTERVDVSTREISSTLRIFPPWGKINMVTRGESARVKMKMIELSQRNNYRSLGGHASFKIQYYHTRREQYRDPWERCSKRFSDV